MQKTHGLCINGGIHSTQENKVKKDGEYMSSENSVDDVDKTGWTKQEIEDWEWFDTLAHDERLAGIVYEPAGWDPAGAVDASGKNREQVELFVQERLRKERGE